MTSRPAVRRQRGSRAARLAGTGGLVALAALAAPAAVAAHQLTGRFTSPIPLGAYLIGAGLAVGA